MNALPEFFTGSSSEQLLADILAPLSIDAPCGSAARFDPVFTEIRLLREADDPSLPMGQWERPLKLSDWAGIEARCVAMLCTRSKHVQIAVWLVEAWMRQRGFAGLCQGLCMLEALLRSHWSGLHPQLEEDDVELRLAPLQWLNESLSQAVRVHAVLLPVEQARPPYITLADWDRVAAQEAMEPVGKAAPQGTGEGHGPLSRAEILACAGQSPDWLRATGHALEHGLASLQAINQLLVEQVGDEAPGLHRLAATLEAAQRVIGLLQSSYMPPAAPIPAAIDDDAPFLLPPPPGTTIQLAAPLWRNRSEAYATLEALAAYLMDVEPHSPVPFLIRRALHWGSMPLPELIAEIIREEGDLNRLVNVLGLKM